MKDKTINQISLNSENQTSKDKSSLSQSVSLSSIRLLSISGAARLMKLGRDSVKTLINQGKLGFIRIGKQIRIPLFEIEKFLLSETQKQLIPHSEPELSDHDLEKLMARKKRSKAPRPGAEIFDEIMEEASYGNCD